MASVSARAQRVWDRLMDWYGTRLGETYGPKPPKDWCDVVDAADNETVKVGLSVIRRDYVSYPPTFPQFCKAMKARDDGKDETRNQHSLADNKAAWDKYLAAEPEEARLKYTLARCAQIEATTHPSNPAYAQSRAEEWTAQQALLALWERRRNARKVV